MKQIVLTVEDSSLVPKLKAALKLLQGVVDVKVVGAEDKPKPNKETIEAIKEVRSGKYAGKIDVSSKDTVVKSIMEV